MIVGASHAGASAAVALRDNGFDGTVTVIGNEPVLPYQRPPLSKKYLTGEMSFDRLLLRQPEFYAGRGIEMVTGKEVAAFDPDAGTLTLADGSTGKFDKIALCTGSRPRRLPALNGGGLDNVFLMRTLDDADRLASQIVAGRRMVVVGGGYIGLEAASVAASCGMEVTVVEAAPRILMRVACKQTSDVIRNLHHANGTRIVEGVKLARLENCEGGIGSGALARAVLEDGTEIDADVAVVGIGIDPNVQLAERAGLAIDNGIAVDEAGRTSHRLVFAAGDCASFPWQGRRIRLESVQNAQDQAVAAAKAMLDMDVAYQPVPWFWSDQFDAHLQICGLGQDYDRIIERDNGQGSCSYWYYRGDEFLAVDAVNDARSYMVAKRFLEIGYNPDAEAIGDPSSDLKAMLKAAR